MNERQIFTPEGGIFFELKKAGDINAFLAFFGFRIRAGSVNAFKLIKKPLCQPGTPPAENHFR